MTKPKILKTHILKIKKRDGRIVHFESQKIEEAIFKALTATQQGDGEIAKKLTAKVIDILNRRFKKEEIPTVEQIQDIVEEVLILEDLVKTAKAYILYREQRRKIREAITVAEEAVDRVDQYLEKLDWEVQENANMAFSLQGLNQYGVSYIVKKYWLNKIYPKELREANESGDLHLHNLDSLSTYCCGWDLYNLLLKGFGGVSSKIESRPPKHFRSALGQIVNFFYTLQGECFSADTQVLTDSGWKYFYEVKENDKIFTLNNQTDEIELQKPIRFYEFNYDGELYNFKSKKLDLLVTPNHNLLVKNFRNQKYTFIKAIDFNPDFYLIPVSSQNQSFKKLEFIKISSNPGIKKLKYSGKVYCLEVPNHTLYVRRNGKACWSGNSAGAQAVSNFDTLLAPFIRYDNLNYQQVKQGLQEFLFNMAIPTRVGFQCPFTNITLDLKPSPAFANQPVIIGGKPQKETYGEFEEEMKIFNKAFYEGILEGDKSKRPFHFPIPTINITKDFPWDESAFDGIFEASAKYGTNYFANYINSEMKPDDVKSMCLDKKEEILIRNSKTIKRISIEEVAESYKERDFDKEGWAECKKEGNLEVLSLNPQNLKLEWSPIKRFLKIVDKKAVEIITEDGKKATFSLKHPIAVYTPKGIQMKFAKDIEKRDYFLTLKKANNEVLSKNYQKIENLVLNEDLAKILGYFVADGNYLFKRRKQFGKLSGLQFSFKAGDFKNINLIKFLVKKIFNLLPKEKQDPRYNTYYLYIYNAELARKLYKAGFRKYGRLPQMLFNSPYSVIKIFLDFYFKGNGYEKRKEIHLNDLELSRDLVLLYSLVGQPLTYRLRKKSQVIYLQHSKSKIKKGKGWLNNPILAERVPGWIVTSTAKVPGLVKSRMVGLNTLEKYKAFTQESLKIKNSDIYLVRVKEIKIKNYKTLKDFYDIELEKNHLFVHSLGQVSFNCCRLRLDLTELYNRGGGGLFGSGANTGSLGVVTINLPRIGYLSKTKKEFFERLEKIMDLAKESLEIKRKAIENFIEKGLYPYSRFYLSGVKQLRGSYYGNHFSTIGLVGMNEAVLNFLGEDISSKKGRKFALEVLNFMRERLVKYQKETGNLYNLEATPAEGTSFRLALKDKEKYPDIITAGTKKIPYYTNSSQLPVNFTDDIFEALKLQDELQCCYSGGTVLHLFLGERISNIEAVKSLIKKIFENFRLPYITITPSFSICPSHGYLEGEHFECPKCTIKQPCEVYSRIVGYYRPVQQFNIGKQQEFKERKEFKIKNY